MPISVPRFPSIALGLLKPALQAIGEICDVRYFSLDYLDRAGADLHATLTDVTYYMAHVGEWVFTGAAHNQADHAALPFLTECFARDYPDFCTPGRLAAFLRARREAPAFIQWCFESIDWRRYDIVGFTTSFQQTMASLALARRIKQAHPDIQIVFGGVNCLDQMGRTLLAQYEFLDAVCVGEGDRCFPEWVRRLRAGEALEGITGMAVRANQAVVAGNDAVTDLDALPFPDYDDFFRQHAQSSLAALYSPSLVFETARGCWWGAKSHCTFCGLNGTHIAFRVKSQDRAYDELAYLVARHHCADAANTDKILDTSYFQEFIPRLAAANLGLNIYYEAKVGMSPDELALLAQAGIRKVQFGIETFDTDLLRLMAKGSTMLQNIETMKLCAEHGIYVEWLALSGFPGERPEHYDRLAKLLPKLFHLQPPAAFIRARADRFSPYERDPGRFGVKLEPLPAYRHIFPFDDNTVRALANHFTLCSAELSGHDGYVAETAAQYALWQAEASQACLWYEVVDQDIIEIHDTRQGVEEIITNLQGVSAALLRLCPVITHWRALLAGFGGQVSGGEAALMAASLCLQAQGFLLREGNRLLALPLRQPGPRRALSWPEIRDRQGRA